MALNAFGKATSLAFTKIGNGPAGPISKIQNYDFKPDGELPEFLAGDSRVVTHYEGTITGTIMVEIADMAAYAQMAKGQAYTNVILTVAAAKTSGGVAQGGSATITFSRAVISDLGNLAHGNEDSTPVVAAVTFKLDKDPAGADPTIAIAEVT